MLWALLVFSVSESCFSFYSHFCSQQYHSSKGRDTKSVNKPCCSFQSDKKKTSNDKKRSLDVPLCQLLNLFLKHISRKTFYIICFYLPYSFNKYIFSWFLIPFQFTTGIFIVSPYDFELLFVQWQAFTAFNSYRNGVYYYNYFIYSLLHCSPPFVLLHTLFTVCFVICLEGFH